MGCDAESTGPCSCCNCDGIKSSAKLISQLLGCQAMRCRPGATVFATGKIISKRSSSAGKGHVSVLSHSNTSVRLDLLEEEELGVVSVRTESACEVAGDGGTSNTLAGMMVPGTTMDAPQGATGAGLDKIEPIIRPKHVGKSRTQSATLHTARSTNVIFSLQETRNSHDL